MNKKTIFALSFVFDLVALVSFGSPHALAAWTAADDFNSYTAGTSLNGDAGGSGWTGNWSVSGGTVTTENAPTGMTGISGKTVNIGANEITRSFAATTGVTEMYFRFKPTLTTVNSTIRLQVAGVAERITIVFNSSGNITANGTTIQSYSANTTYVVGLKWGHNGNNYAISINGGAYSGDVAIGGIDMNNLVFGSSSDGATNTYYFDDISVGPFSTLPNISGSGTANRIAKFTTSNTINNSLLSDDGSNTVLNSGNLFLQSGSGVDAAMSGTLNFGTATATSMVFGRSGQLLVINSNVGIGTTTPADLLSVGGGFFANTIRVLGDQLGLDTLSAGLLAIGSTTANAISIGRPSITTFIRGPLFVGTTTTAALNTNSNCSSVASPAVCGAASAGSVAMPTGVSTLVVNTTAVTANSQILVTEDSSLGARLGITCNTTTGRVLSVNARTAGTSFTIKSSSNPNANKACLSYWIVN